MSGSSRAGRVVLVFLLLLLHWTVVLAQAPGGGAGDRKVEASIRIDPQRMQLGPGESRRVTVFVTGKNGWTGPVEVIADGRGVTAQPRLQRVETLPAQREITVTAAPNARPGQEPDVIFIVRTVDKGKSLDRARLRLEPGTAAAPAMPPRPAGGPLQDSGAPVPPLPPRFGSAANALQDANQHVDGLAATLASGDPVIDPQKAAQQVAMLKFYDALVAELKNPASFAVLEDEGLDVDPEILTAMVEASGILERDAELRRAVAEVAGLGVPPLMLIDVPVDAEYSKFPSVKPGQPVDWNSARNRVERLILQIKLARVSEGLQKVVTGPSRQAVEALNDAVDKLEEKLGGDKTPGRAKRALRHLMIATAAITLADVVAKASMAFLPNEVTAFYVEVNGMRRNEGDPPISIRKGQQVPIRVLMETRSPGGQIVTPSEVIGWVFGAASKHPKYDDMVDRIIGLDKAQISEQMKKEVRDEFLQKIEKLWTRVTGMPAIREWLNAMDKSWDVKAFNNRPMEVNSNNVLMLKSQSPRLLEIVQSGPETDRKYAFKGIHQGNQAGYHVALKKDLIEEMQTMSRVQLGRLAVVNVVEDEKMAVHPNAGKPCAMNGQNPGVVVPDGPCVIMITGECGCPH